MLTALRIAIYHLRLVMSASLNLNPLENAIVALSQKLFITIVYTLSPTDGVVCWLFSPFYYFFYPGWPAKLRTKKVSIIR